MTVCINTIPTVKFIGQCLHCSRPFRHRTIISKSMSACLRIWHPIASKHHYSIIRVNYFSFNESTFIYNFIFSSAGITSITSDRKCTMKSNALSSICRARVTAKSPFVFCDIVQSWDGITLHYLLAPFSLVSRWVRNTLFDDPCKANFLFFGKNI